MDWTRSTSVHIPIASFWRVFVDAEAESADLDFLPPQALSRQLDYIKTFYQRRDEKIDEMCARPFIYLSSDEMDLFVNETSAKLLQIFRMLWPTPPMMDDLYSALELSTN